MAHRTGIGATLAASVVFAVILVSGLAVYESSQGAASLYSTADSANYLAGESQVLEGAAGVNILSQVERFVASAPLPCSSPQGPIQRYLANVRASAGAPNVSVTATASLGSGGSADDPAALKPYNGSLPGSLDLQIDYLATGRYGDALLNRTGVDFAHLGVDLAAGQALCLASVAAIAALLDNSSAESCTPADIAPLVERAWAPSASADSREGVGLGYTYSVTSGTACVVSFRVYLTQSGIEGPEGEFSAVFEGGGGASVRVSPPPPPA